MRIPLALALTTLVAFGSEPRREEGLSVHMLPESAAQVGGGHGGFIATDPSTKRREQPVAAPAELLSYFHRQSPKVQQNGIWVVTTHPEAYSPAEHSNFAALVKICITEGIPIYKCRGSELPNGWAPAK